MVECVEWGPVIWAHRAVQSQHVSGASHQRFMWGMHSDICSALLATHISTVAGAHSGFTDTLDKFDKDGTIGTNVIFVKPCYAFLLNKYIKEKRVLFCTTQ